MLPYEMVVDILDDALNTEALLDVPLSVIRAAATALMEEERSMEWEPEEEVSHLCCDGSRDVDYDPNSVWEEEEVSEGSYPQ